MENNAIYLAKILNGERDRDELSYLLDFDRSEGSFHMKTMTHAENLFNEMREIGHEIKDAYQKLMQAES